MKKDGTHDLTIRLDPRLYELLRRHTFRRNLGSVSMLMRDVLTGWCAAITDFDSDPYFSRKELGFGRIDVPDRYPGYRASLGIVDARYTGQAIEVEFDTDHTDDYPQHEDDEQIVVDTNEIREILGGTNE